MISKWRFWLVWWMYAAAVAHLVVGVLLTWFMQLPNFADYNQLVLSKFWSGSVPAGALELHVWWVNLFGATLQNLAILMLLLIYLGNRLRLQIVWGWLVAGLLLWAPQDMWISAQRELWMHVWLDAVALLVMVPPLTLLWQIDRKIS